MLEKKHTNLKISTSLNLNFNMIQYAFGKFPKVMAMWVLMQLATLLVVYPAFYYWSSHRKPGKAGKCFLLIAEADGKVVTIM